MMAAAMLTTASATEYVVYNGGQELAAGQTQLPVNFWTWEGTINTVDNANEHSKDFTVNNDGWWGGGWSAKVSPPPYGGDDDEVRVRED